jgi:hypothetical protein
VIEQHDEWLVGHGHMGALSLKKPRRRERRARL